MPNRLNPLPLSSTLHFPPVRGSDGAIEVPPHLPDHPPFPVSTRRHVLLDGESVPIPFVRHVLTSIAQPMLESVHGPPVFTVDSDADDADPASTRLVVVSNPLPFPNCVLVVSFDDRPDDEFGTPAHGLIWATSGSSLFEPLFDLDEPAGSPSDEHEPHSSETLLTLPAFYLHVPFQHAWTQIHDFMYTRSPADLLDTLSIHIPTPTQHARTIPSGAATPSSDQGDLLDQLEGLRQIYLTAVCLQLPDDVLWDILHAEWSRLYKLYHESPRD